MNLRANPISPSLNPARGDTRRVPRGRRGVILLFVVVLLTLLAVLGSAYLISAKIDAGSVNPKARGGPADTFNPDLRDPVATRLDRAAEAAQRRIFLDDFDVQAGPPAAGTSATTYAGSRAITGLLWRPSRALSVAAVAPFNANPNVYRPMSDVDGLGTATNANDAAPLRFPYYHLDAEGGTDPFLASRTVWFNPAAADETGTAVGDFVWPWISAPLVGLPDFPVDNIFYNPFTGTAIDFDAVGDASRQGLRPTTGGPIDYPAPTDVTDAGGTATFYNDRSRIYPALGVGSAFFTAADADGDGVADSGLVPLVADATQPIGNAARYIDVQTDMAYFYAVRIVDNNAAVNVNQALSNAGDYNFAGGAAVLSGAFAYNGAFTAPNWGIWPANVGLLQLFYQGVDGDTDGYDDNGNGRVRNEEFRRMVPSRLGNRTAMTVTGTALPLRGDMQYSTLGEKLAINQASLLTPADKTEAMLSLNGTDLATPFRGDEDAAALLYQGGGWLRPDASASPLERAMPDALGVQSGNYTPSQTFPYDFFTLAPGAGNGTAAETQRTLRSVWAASFMTADPDMTDFFAALPGGTARPTMNPVNAFRGKNRGAAVGPGGTFAISPRPGIVTRNGVTQAFPPQVLTPLGGGDPAVLTRGDTVPAGMPAYALGATPEPGGVRPPTRANVNTARFNELWRAYFNVMVASAPATPANAAGFTAPAIPAGGGADAFENTSLNLHGASALTLTREQVLLLRAALAAVNTMDVRDVDRVVGATPPAGYGGAFPAGYGPGDPDPSDNDVTVAEVALGRPAAPGGAGTAPFVRVFGTEAQPVIDEVLMDVDDATGAVTNMSLELFNPYPFPINMEGWQLAAVDRTTAPGTATLVPLVTFGAANGTGFIPASDLTPAPPVPPATVGTPATYSPGMMYVDGGTPPTGATAPIDNATATPTAGGTPRIAVSTAFINLANAADANGVREIVLVRPPRMDVALLTYGPSLDLQLQNMAPLDSVDFRGLAPVAGGSGNRRVRYARPTIGSGGLATASQTRDWDYVYGGPWVSPAAAPLTNPANSTYVRVLGTDPLTPDADQDGEIGQVNALATQDGVSGPLTTVTQVQVGPVLSGPWRAPGAGQPTYPYGGFARDGDALGVPFVGGYRLEGAAGTAADFVSLNLDLAFAGAETATAGNAGHFYEHAVAGAADNWAVDFFDYLAAFNTPGEDRFPFVDQRYFPVTDPASPYVNLYADPTLNARNSADPLWVASATSLASFGGGTNPPTAPSAMTRLFFGANPATTPPLNAVGFDVGLNDYDEAFYPVEGLINLNTAGVGILKTLPLAVNATGNVTAGAETAAADSLFTGRYQQANRMEYAGSPTPVTPTGTETVPLRSLFTLLDFGDTVLDTTANPVLVNRSANGDITGRLSVDGSVTDDTTNFYDIPGAAAAGDYEQYAQTITRLSNLTTLRSDSFTVYLVVQAWQLQPTLSDPRARLMREQRTAFTVDRRVLPFKDIGGTPTPWAAADVMGEAYQQALTVTPIPTK